jgi:hypothetical protein
VRRRQPLRLEKEEFTRLPTSDHKELISTFHLSRSKSHAKSLFLSLIFLSKKLMPEESYAYETSCPKILLAYNRPLHQSKRPLKRL